MNKRVRSLLQGSFIGDALALPTHWVFNTEVIKKNYGRITSITLPDNNENYPTKKQGDLSRFGNEALLLLQSIRALGKFDLIDFSGKLDLIGASPPEDQLVAVARIAPLFLLYKEISNEELIQAARAQANITHQDPLVADAAEYFARVTLDLLAGKDLKKAIEDNSQIDFQVLDIKRLLKKAKSLFEINTTTAVKKLGQEGTIENGVPAVIYILLRYSGEFEEALIENAMAGGDSSARGLLIGMILGAFLGVDHIPEKWLEALNCKEKLELSALEEDTQGNKRVIFTNQQGEELSGTLEIPAIRTKAYAVFAHCFTCTKDIFSVSRISKRLREQGIAVLRFDFTGLGKSTGNFADSNFSSNIQDIISAAAFLRKEYQGPGLLIGHSFGGAAAIATAEFIPEVRGVVTIAAPSSPTHIEHAFKDKLDEIKNVGHAQVMIMDREFTIKQQLVEDNRKHNLLENLANAKFDLLVLHSPQDDIVTIDNARKIFEAAKHPKSFISLDGMDHLLSRPEDTDYASNLIAAWSKRFIKT